MVKEDHHHNKMVKEEEVEKTEEESRDQTRQEVQIEANQSKMTE